MSRSILLLVISLFTLFIQVENVRAMQKKYDFESTRKSMPPEGLVLENDADTHSSFFVDEMKDDPDHNKALVLLGSLTGSQRQVYAVDWFSHVKDGYLSVKFQHEGYKDTFRIAGFVWRYESQKQCYALECDTAKSRVELVRYEENKRTVITRVKHVFPVKTWVVLQVAFKGDQTICMIDGQKILESHDSAILTPGKVGLMVNSDVSIFFDDFKIESDE